MSSNETIFSTIQKYFYITVGAFLMAVAFNGFLNPLNLIPGGVTGLSTIFEDLLGIEPAYSQWAMNIPLFILGWVFLGNNYAIKTVYGTFMLPLAIFLTRNIGILTDNMIMGAAYGGIGVGLGLGLIFRMGGSTGGLDTPAQILNKFFNISLGKAIAVFDAGVIVLGVIYIAIANDSFNVGVEQGLFALIALYTTSKFIDLMEMGGEKRKAVYIISEQYEEIKNMIFNDINRGTTMLNITGGYTNNDKKMVLCIVEVRKLIELKRKINEIDENVFMYITDASEVHGEGFVPRF